MADNVPITAGTGTTIGTDDVAGVHIQKVKLVDGTTDGADGIAGDAANGLDVDVTRLPPLVAGTANIGDVDVLTLPALVAGSANIGDVDVLTVPAPLSTTGGGTEAAALRVTLASDSTGLVSVDDNAGSLTVDAPVGTPVATRLSDGAAFLTSASGRLAVDPSGVTSPVSGTVTANLAAGTNNIGDVDVLTVPADPFGVNADAASATGSISAKLRAIAATGIPITSIAAGTTNIGDVDVLTMPNVTLAAGTNTNEVVGDVAHDVAVAGNPLVVAGASQDTDDTAPPNRVDAEGDATRLATDRDGSVFVRPHGPQVWSYHLNTSSAQTDASVHAAPAAGLSLYVGTIVFSSGAATAINMFLEEGASTVLGPYYLEATAGRGMAVTFNPPKKITANTALTITTSAAIAHAVDITGFTAQG